MKNALSMILLPIKFLAWTLAILAPTIGVWVASSLAAYLNGPIWLACAAGLLLFPVGPLVWDLWAARRFERKQEKRKAAGKTPRSRFTTFSDRLVLRTFFLNVGFIAALVASYPQAGFEALATRGDWVLDGWDSPRADVVRPVLFGAAEGLVWVYELTRDDPYERFDDDTPTPTPSPEEYGEAETKPEIPPSKRTPRHPEEPPRSPSAPPQWPLPNELHPVVEQIPEDMKSSYEEVARYIAAHEPDPFLRVKALNDFVADRVAYDVPALTAGVFPPQDAKTVFETRSGVCAGYAKLMVAMAEVTGDEVVYVSGVSRDDSGGVAGGGHAWNAARIEGKWYLIDTTWNAGYVNGDTFTKSYRTDYLFTPPEVFGSDHLPNDDAWQLRSDPLSHGEFIRQPMLKPEFYAQGLRLLTPKRSQIDATSNSVDVRIENPGRKTVFASVVPISGGSEEKCDTRGTREVQIRCAVAPGATYELRMFAGTPGKTRYPMVGQFQVVAR